MLESISLFSSSGKYPFEEFLGQRKPFDAAKNRLIACGGAKGSQCKLHTPARIISARDFPIIGARMMREASARNAKISAADKEIG
jgi:hypothetical protein